MYDDYIPVDITRIVVNSSDTGEEEIEIGSGEGTFSFKMPAHDVTVMFYLTMILRQRPITITTSTI